MKQHSLEIHLYTATSQSSTDYTECILFNEKRAQLISTMHSNLWDPSNLPSSQNHQFLLSLAMESESIYELPAFAVNENGWGPSTLPDDYKDLPYAFFSRDENLGMIMDLTQVSFSQNRGCPFLPLDSHF